MKNLFKGIAHKTKALLARAPALAATIGVLAVAIASGAFLAGAAVGDESAPPAAAPGEASSDAGFSRDMQRHHAQAVEMSSLILDSSTDPQVRTLARDIMLTQQQQIGQMYGWLRLWGLPLASTEPAMAWVEDKIPGMASHDMSAMGGTDMPGMDMPGMATDRQIRRLDALAGARADRYYLQLMIPHHKGALGMASDASHTAETPQVRALAANILMSQTAELRVLRKMLAARGGPISE